MPPLYFKGNFTLDSTTTNKQTLEKCSLINTVEAGILTPYGKEPFPENKKDEKRNEKKFFLRNLTLSIYFLSFFSLYNPRTIQICAKGLIMETKAQKTTPGWCINFPAKFTIKRIFLLSSLFKSGV